MDETWIVRERNKVFDPALVYANNPDLFTLEFHHGGEFTTFPEIIYERGNITFVDKVNSGHFSVIIVNDIMISLGYSEEDLNELRYHFKVPGEDLDFGLRPLGNDSDVIGLLMYAQTNKMIEVYVENTKTVTESDLGECTQVQNAQLNDVEVDLDDGGTVEGSEDDNDSDFIIDEENLVEDPDVDMNEFRAAVDIDISDEGEDNVSEDEGDLEVDLDDFDSLSDSDDDTKLQKAVRNIRKNKKKAKESLDCPFYVGQAFIDRVAIKSMVVKHAIETRRQLFITKNDTERFRVVCHGINPKMGSRESNTDGAKVGGTLGNLNKGGRSQKVASYSKSSKPKPKKENQTPTCPWILHVSNHLKEGSLVVKTLQKEHQCIQTRDVGLCTISWLTKEIEPIILVNPNIPLVALQDHLQKKYQVSITKDKIVRAKMFAKEKVQGDYEAQYKMLRDYAGELIRANPGTTVKIDVEQACDPSSPTRQFRRIYICLGALKEGFKICGRELLGLDGCFMKGPFPGQILTAVGVDANNGIYPVAYALVESETTSSWSWFLDYLGDDLDLTSNSNFTFISDRQKGLIPAITKVFPSAEHRYCARHIHENMKQKWRGQKFKNLFRNCASATTTQWFDRSMKTILEEDKDLHNWLKEIPPRHWSRSHFSGRSKCDVLLNNLCEVFNRQLVNGRDKPIITCLEYIREYLMKRIVVVHKMIAKCKGPLTPAATKIFEKIMHDAAEYTVIWNGASKYQVTGRNQDQKTVNIDQRTCSCRKWDLTGMPCRHAVACIWNMATHGLDNGIPELWVDQCYWLETWKKVYAHTIDPINGSELWTPSSCPTTLTAPKHHKHVGRPKKKRKNSAEEVSELSQNISSSGKMSRKGNTVTCDKCKKKGHNKRTCNG